MVHRAMQPKIAIIGENLFSDVLDLYAAGNLQLFVRMEDDLNWRDREPLMMLQLMNHLAYL